MRRRRRNPFNLGGNVGGIAALLAVGGVAYLLYRLYNKGSQVVTAAGAAVSKALVPNPTATANIVLDSGVEVPYESVSWHGAGSLDWWSAGFTHNARFDYKGITYELVNESPDETNTYYALRVDSSGNVVSPGGASGSF